MRLLLREEDRAVWTGIRDSCFSLFFFHIILLAAAFLYVQTTPRTHTPPFYDVKLVGQPAEPTALPQASQSANQASAPQRAAKTLPKGKKSVSRARKAPAVKGAMPELARLAEETGSRGTGAVGSAPGSSERDDGLRDCREHPATGLQIRLLPRSGSRQDKPQLETAAGRSRCEGQGDILNQ